MVNGTGILGEDRAEDINVAAASAYRAGIDTGKPLSERKLAAMSRSRSATSRTMPSAC